MTKTVLWYIEDNEKYLMLNRNKKTNDLNIGKWIGVGGKIEHESIMDALHREVFEETNLEIIESIYFGEVQFFQDNYQEIMYLFKVTKFKGLLSETCEGTLKWINKNEILKLPLWAGDKIFLERLFNNKPFQLLVLRYDGEKLKDHTFIETQ